MWHKDNRKRGFFGGGLSGGLKSTMPLGNPVEVTPETSSTAKKKQVRQAQKTQSKAGDSSLSLDEKYAQKTGLWVCEYCETLNLAVQKTCLACGCER